VANDAFLPTQSTIYIYPGWANLKVGGQSKKIGRCRAYPFLIHTFKKTCRRPWCIVRSRFTTFPTCSPCYLSNTSVVLPTRIFRMYKHHIEDIPRSLLLFYLFLICLPHFTLTEGGHLHWSGSGKKNRSLRSRSNVRKIIVLVPVSLLLSYNNYYQSTQFWRRGLTMSTI